MKIIITLIFNIIVIQAIGQVNLRGIIKDSTNKPISFANVYLKKNKVGTISNDKGAFFIHHKNLFYKHDTLIISYLGYKSVSIPVYTDLNNEYKIILEPQINQLREVIVSANTIKYTGKQIVKKAIRKTKKNYSKQTIVQQGFYRELLEENNIAIKLNEATFDFKSEKYPQAKYSRKSFHDYWDDFHASSRFKKRGIFSNFAQYWPIFITHKDKVTIKESRVSLDFDSEERKNTTLGDPLGGPINIIALDDIKYRSNFFNPSLIKRYNYKLIGLVKEQGQNYYLIEFEPKKKIKRYFHNYIKKVRVALYKGTILIAQKGFVVKRVNCESLDWSKVRSNTSYFKPFKIKYSVEYQPSKDGWVLGSINYTAEYQTKNNPTNKYKWHRNLKLSLPQTIQFNDDEASLFPLRHETLRYKTNTYNPSYWETFVTSKEYIPLSPKYKMDLEANLSLNQQFNLLNQKIADIKTPAYINKPMSKDLDNSALEQENDYATAVLQKMNKNERNFLSFYNKILERDYNLKPKEQAKPQQYFVVRDSMQHFVYHEMLNDSTSKKIFDFTNESLKNKNGNISSINFTKDNIHYLVDYNDELGKVYKSKKKSEELLIDSIPNINELYIVNDSVIVYTVFDNHNRVSKMYLHKTGYPNQTDLLLFHETDVEYDIELSLSASKKFIIANITSKNQDEIWVFNKATQELKPITKRTSQAKYTLNHFQNEDSYLLLEEKEESVLKKINIENHSEQVIYKTRQAIEEYLIDNEYLILTEYRPFDMDLKLINLKTKKEKIIHPQKGFNTINFVNFVTDSNLVYFSTESLIHPIQTFSLNYKTGKVKLFEEDKYSFIGRQGDFVSKLIHIPNQEGLKIPVLISYDKKAIKDSVTAVLIQAYGAYGARDYSVFEETDIVYLKKGFVIAKPAVRGSGTLGNIWYKEGKLLKKQNTFNDFITVIDALKHKFEVSDKQIFAKGVSAGGLIMGVLANTYSNKLGGIILDRPFLDLSNSMKDSSKYLTTIEYQEWGNPNDKAVAEYQASYSPFQNISQQDYTNLFFRASFYDKITPAEQILRSVYKIRQNNTSNNLIIMKVNFDENHLIRYSPKRIAEEYSFMMYVLLH